MQRLRGRSMHGESLAVNDRKGLERGDLKGTGASGLEDRRPNWVAKNTSYRLRKTGV